MRKKVAVRMVDFGLSLVVLLFLLVRLGNPAVPVTMGENKAEAGDDWPMFHHDPQHSGYSTSTGSSTNHTIWSYTTGGPVESSPAVVDGKVYVGSNDKNVYCLNAATGARIWTYTTGDHVFSSPAVADDKVYVGSLDGKVYCLNAATGTFIWNYTTELFDVHSSPVVVDGRVYVGSWNDNKVYCLNATTGVLIWSYVTGNIVWSSPAVADDKVYVGSLDNRVYCLDAITGALIWNYTTGDYVQSSPAVADGKVYVGSWDHNFYCLDATTGALIWNYTTGDGVYSSPAVVSGKVYVGSWDNKVYCLNTADGALIWNYTTGDWVSSSSAVADGKVYVGSRDNRVYCLNSDTGAFIWSYTTGDTVGGSPAIADGRVYVGSSNGKVYCFGSKKTWTVDDDGPADFSSVQAAINAASPEDIICVKDGTYYENITVSKRLSLIGMNGTHLPVIDGGGAAIVVKVIADGVVMQGFNVTNSSSYDSYGDHHLGGGIQIFGVSECVIVNNTVCNNLACGVSLVNANNNTVASNICIKNEFGIRLWSWSPQTASGNVIDNNACSENLKSGISLWSYVFKTWTTSYNNITNNFVSQNGLQPYYGEGIYIGTSDGDVVLGNTMFSNYYGLTIDSSVDCKIFHNDFIWNNQQGHVHDTSGRASVNQLDDGYPSGGNYWSDYNGTDANHDGVGDTPYVLNADNQDRYPFMNLNGWKETVMFFSLSPNPVIVGKTVVLQGNLSDRLGQPLSNTHVSLHVNGSFAGNLFTNASGWFQASAPVNLAGTYLVNVSYPGNSTYSPSSRVETLTVSQLFSTKVEFTLFPNPATYGQAITLKGNLTTSSSIPVGGAPLELWLKIGVNPWQPVAMLSTNGTGWFQASGRVAAVGTYQVAVVYRGTSQYKMSYKIETLAVNP